MKKIALIIMLFCAHSLYAQYTHTPKIGEVIEFYPVCDSVKGLCKGYDCFYDENKAYDGKKLNAKPKNRLLVNRDKLTPFEEIEGHSFTVNHTQKYAHTGNSNDEAFILFLTRDDGIKVILQIPFHPNEASNDITKSMVLQFKNDKGLANGTINLPFIEVDTLEFSRNNLIGKNVIRFAKEGDYKGQKFKAYNNGKTFSQYIIHYIIERENKLGNSIPLSYFYNGMILHVNKIKYINIPTYTFKQPIVEFEVNDNNSLKFLPLQDYYGRGSDMLLTNYRFCNIFIEADAAMSELVMQLPADTTKFFKDQKLYYGLSKEFFSYNENIHLIDKDDRYVLKKGYYTFDRFALIPTKEELCISAIVCDSLGSMIAIPASSKRKSIGNITYNFFEAFNTQEEVDSIISAREKRNNEFKQYKKQQEQERADTIANIIKKYGKKYGEYYLSLSEYDKEKFETAYSKWGASIAKDIVDGYVRIGWNKEKCLMSWGEPRDINTSIGSWGRHEQWCYYSSYLYFENGKLTSIQK